ncbi:MAG: AlpA family phage regulatory protein [Rhodoferax sp.]|nr:AlpA family phage regulatory protein [Rhodoferax sp.]
MNYTQASIERLPAVLKYLSISKSTLYSMIASGHFKRPIKLGARAVGWLTSDVTEFVEARAAARLAAA